MIGKTLARYFAGQFILTALAVFGGIFVLVILVDYIELMRRTANVPDASALFVAQTSLYRVPLVIERLMPFCVLIGAMSSFLTLSRKMELVIARAAGISAWQFIAPALIAALIGGILATALYNPVSASLQEKSKEMEAILFGKTSGTVQAAQGFWVNQASSEGQAIINASGSQNQGQLLTGLTIFRFSPSGEFVDRIEAKEAMLRPGYWNLKGARFYGNGAPLTEHESYQLKTNLNADQVRESFATPETVSFWQLPNYISANKQAGLAFAGYRLQFHKLIAQPFMLCAMVLLAAAVSLRFFRFGGVQKMVLSGIGAGFLLYVLSKVTEDLSKAELLNPVAAAWLPVCVGGLAGFVALLYQEDG